MQHRFVSAMVIVALLLAGCGTFDTTASPDSEHPADCRDRRSDVANGPRCRAAGQRKKRDNPGKVCKARGQWVNTESIGHNKRVQGCKPGSNASDSAYPPITLPDEPAGAWSCDYMPTMNRNWHDDVLCTKGLQQVRPYLLPSDSFITPDEMKRAAAQHEAMLNSNR